MRLKSFIAAAGAMALVGFLGFRIIDLEQRVSRLAEQLGAPTEPGAPATNSTGTRSVAAISNNCEQRIAALEKRVGQMSWASTKTSMDPTAQLSKEQDILSVVERENSRIRDVQLEWHKGRWMEGREFQLKLFASQQQLTSSQEESLRQVLEKEADGLISVLKKPGLAEDPDQAATEWLKVLQEADERGGKLLTPEQQQAWNFARFFERRALWPWLPEQVTAQR